MFCETKQIGESMALLGDVFTNLTNWIRSWDKVVFVIVMLVFSIAMLLLLIDLIKGFVGSKTKFKVWSFLLLAIIVGLTIYICLAR